MLYVGSVWGVLGKSGSKTEDAFSIPMEITYDDLQMMIGHLGEICYSDIFRNGGMAVQPVWISCVDLPVQREPSGLCIPQLAHLSQLLSQLAVCNCSYVVTTCDFATVS